MSALAPLLEAFFTERRIGQREASRHTVAAYRDAFCLLLRFAHQRTGREPHQLILEDLDAGLIGAFLNHLETGRGASVRTRNARQLSRDALRRLVERHIAVATPACPSLAAKDVTPHTLRHTCAMNLLRHGVDTATIALWLGHEDVRTTYSVYLHADLGLKETAIAKTAPPGTRPGRYRPSDTLLAFLESL